MALNFWTRIRVDRVFRGELLISLFTKRTKTDDELRAWSTR